LRLLEMHANKRREIREVHGDIAAMGSTKNATGDTLCLKSHPSSSVHPLPSRCRGDIRQDEGRPSKLGDLASSSGRTRPSRSVRTR
jgi:hypothetical protein